jgi:hypothetical protein
MRRAWWMVVPIVLSGCLSPHASDGLGTELPLMNLDLTPPTDKQVRSAAIERAIGKVRKLGGTVQRDSERVDDPVIGLDLHKTHASDEDLAILPLFPGLKTLNLYGSRVEGPGLVFARRLENLQSLYLNHTAIGDDALENLRGLKNLRELGLYQTRVTDRGMVILRDLPALQQLSLSGSGITDAGLALLKRAPCLSILTLFDTAATNAGIADLQNALPRLKILHRP